MFFFCLFERNRCGDDEGRNGFFFVVDDLPWGKVILLRDYGVDD